MADISPPTEATVDDAAVDEFANAMKAKLAAARVNKGRGGWQKCSPQELSHMLRDHVEKGDPCDVANFCMFLWYLDAPINSAPEPDAEQRLRKLADEVHVFDSEWADQLHDIADGVKRLSATKDT